MIRPAPVRGAREPSATPSGAATAYGQVDANLRLVDWGGDTGLFAAPPRTGCPVVELLPELLGYEETLRDLSRRGSPLSLPFIQRDGPWGSTRYLDLLAVPSDLYPRGCSLLLQESTAAGEAEQRRTQDFNDNRLALEQLRRQSRDLQLSNAELRRLAALRSDFIATAAHELRHPLTAMMAYLDLLLEDEPGRLQPDQEASLRVVQASVERLAGIIQRLLDVSRLEEGQLEVFLRPMDLVRLSRAVLAELRPRLAEQNLRLVEDLPDGLPTVLLDQDRAAQILHNLLDNAIKYTPGGGTVTLSVGRLPMAEDGQLRLRLMVVDSGVGIPPEEQERLFQRYFRASTAVLTEAQGSGLGLYITRALAELHGAQLGFHSRPGQGSRFWVDFLVADSSASA